MILKNTKKGGIIKILPKLDTSESDKYIDLQNFEVAYFGKTNGSATIVAKQGIADKMNNILVSYTEFNGSIEKFIQAEEHNRRYKENDLSLEKESFKYKKAKIERDFASLKATEMRTVAQQEFFKQLSNNDNNRNS